MNNNINDFPSIVDDMRRPRDSVAGYAVCMGLCELNGATAMPASASTSPANSAHRIGDVWTMIVFGLDISRFEYAYRVDGPYCPEKGQLFDKRHVLLDIYAKAVTSNRHWGEPQPRDKAYHARVVRRSYEWADHAHRKVPMEDLIIYELHVRGFTFGRNSGVSAPGTFLGVREKIPYLKWLGVTAVELILGIQHGQLLCPECEIHFRRGIQPGGKRTAAADPCAS